MSCILYPFIAAAFVLMYFYPIYGASIISIALMILLAMYLSASRTYPNVIEHYRKKLEQRFSDDDISFIKKTAHYWLLPFASKEMSSTNSFITICATALGIISVITQNWLNFILCIAFYILSGYLAGKYNPAHFMQEAAKKDKTIKGIIIETKIRAISEFFVNDWPDISNTKDTK